MSSLIVIGEVGPVRKSHSTYLNCGPGSCNINSGFQDWCIVFNIYIFILIRIALNAFTIENLKKKTMAFNDRDLCYKVHIIFFTL